MAKHLAFDWFLNFMVLHPITVSKWSEQVELVCKMCWQHWAGFTTWVERWGSISISTVNPWPKGGFKADETNPPCHFFYQPPSVHLKSLSRRLHPRETMDEYFSNLQDLAHLIKENPSDRLCFHIKQLLHESLRIENMTLEQILSKAQALMIVEGIIVELVTVPARRCRILPYVPVALPSTPNQ